MWVILLPIIYGAVSLMSIYVYFYERARKRPNPGLFAFTCFVCPLVLIYWLFTRTPKKKKEIEV